MTMKDVSFSFVVKEIFKVKHKKCRCSLRVAAFLILYLSVLFCVSFSVTSFCYHFLLLFVSHPFFLYICSRNNNFFSKEVFMLSKDVQEMIPKIQKFFETQPVEKAWLFGSCSRGEETPTSDIDILVKYERNDKFSLMTISRIMVSLSDLLSKSVDLVEDEGLMPFARKSVERDKLLIYERES